MSNDNPFEQQTQDPTEQFLSELVGEGKKYSDVEQLAKAYVHADKHITLLERQTEELRADLGKDDKINQILEQLSTEKTTTDTAETTTQTTEELSKETLEDLIKNTVTDLEKIRTAEQNRTKVIEDLKTKFGGKANEVLANRAKALNMSLKQLEDMAATSPTAFMTLIEGVQSPTDTGIEGAVNTASLQSTQGAEQVKGHSYYQNMRRENKRRYFSPEIQREREAMLNKLGSEKFFNS